jgi:hypothetical protein
MPLNSFGFLLVIFTGVVVILLSHALDILWTRIVPARVFYYALRAPGVVVHECAHILGCFLTGAKIQKVVFFSERGGSVTYTPSALPWIGDMVIGIAPLFCIPLLLAAVSWIFSTWLGCWFPVFPQTIDSIPSLYQTGAGITGMIAQNLITRFNGWFLLYLYLALSLVLSLAPSVQDLKNAMPGIVLIAFFGTVILWSGSELVVQVLEYCTLIVSMGFALGLVFELIALAISLPLLVIYAHRQ